MKNPLSSQTVGVINFNFLFVDSSATKLEKNLQKTAKSSGYLIFFSTFAKKLKIKELW